MSLKVRKLSLVSLVRGSGSFIINNSRGFWYEPEEREKKRKNLRFTDKLTLMMRAGWGRCESSEVVVVLTVGRSGPVEVPWLLK